MQKSPFYLLFSPDTKNEFPGNIEAPSLRLLRAPAAFSPSPRTRGLFAITAHQWPFRHHHPPVATAPSPSRQFQASNTAYHPHSDGEAPSLRLLRTPVAFSPSSSTSGLFALTAHPWRRRPRRRGRSKLPAQHITRTATARRRRYVCSAHQWPFSPSSHTSGDGEAPSLRLLRTPVAFSPSSSTSGLFALIAHQWRRRPRRRGRSQHTQTQILI